MKRVVTAVLVVTVLIGVPLCFAQKNAHEVALAQKRRAVAAEVLEPGRYLLTVKKPFKMPADWPVQCAQIGRGEFLHDGNRLGTDKHCGGDVHRGRSLHDDGTGRLTCERCNKVWITREGDPQK